MKKYYFLILCIVLFSNSFSQVYTIPEIEFTDSTELWNPYVNTLKIEDKNALIVNLSSSNNWKGGTTSNFILFLNNGQVELYETFHPYSWAKTMQSKTEKIKIKKKNYKYYWELLLDFTSKMEYSFNDSLLSICEKTLNDSTIIETYVRDGTTFKIELTQGYKLLSHTNESPYTYIEREYPGSDERQRFLDTYLKILDLINRF